MSSLDAMLSSTSKDLATHRKLAEDACNRAGFSAKTMDYLSAENDKDAIDVSMRLVGESEVYIGIFGMRYGYRPKDPRNPNDISITEMEYRRAKELGMPLLIYIMSDDHPPPDTTGMGLKEAREAQNDFFESDPRSIEKLELLKKELMANEIVGFFESAEDLRLLVMQSLFNSELRASAKAYYEKQQEQLANQPTAQHAATPRTDIPYPPELYAYPPYSGQNAVFVGRRDEMHTLNDWSKLESNHSMLVLEAIGGMGKSALTWRWIQDRAVPFDGVFWYSFYEGGADMTDFLRHALAYVTRRSPKDLRGTSFPQMLSELVYALQHGRFLLVLDGLERVLVAYHRWNAAQMRDDEVEEGADYRDCTNPRDNDVLRQLAGCDPSRVLITSRLVPRTLTEGTKPLATVQHIKLKGLSRTDAHRLWREQGITWSDDGLVDGFINQFGRHSLLLKLLIDIIKKNRRANGNFDMWYELYGRDFDVFEDVKAKRHHILQFAYEGLDDQAKKLLSQMAALGNAIDIDTLNVFNPYLQTPESKQEQIEYERSNEYKHTIHRFDAILQDLEERGLIWWDVQNKQYDLHPVVRGYAFLQLNDDDKPETFDAIYNFFEEQERGNYRTDFSNFAEMQNLIAMYNALIGVRDYDTAAQLFVERLRHSLVQAGLGLYHKAYELMLPLFPNGLTAMPILTSSYLQRSILNLMGTVLSYLSRVEDALLVHRNEVSCSLDDPDEWIISLNKYGNALMNANYLAQSFVAKQLVRKLAQLNHNVELISHAQYYLIEINCVLGRWHETDSHYKTFDQNSSNLIFQVAGKTWYANSLIQQSVHPSEINLILNDCVQINQFTQTILHTRIVSRLYGDLALREGEYESAINYYTEAARIGNEQGLRDPAAWSGLARAYALNGNLTEALRIVNDGIEDHGFAAAMVYMKNGDIEEAKEAALEFYTWAWAQGEPYVRRWELEQAREILAELGEPEPQLPVWDESKYEPFENEAEIRALIERLKEEQADQGE